MSKIRRKTDGCNACQKPDRPALLNDLLCFYVAYQTKGGLSWRITNTQLDLDKAAELVEWVERKEKEIGCEIAPIFWKRLET